MNGAKAFASNIWRLERDQHLNFLRPSEFDMEIVLDNQIRSGRIKTQILKRTWNDSE